MTMLLTFDPAGQCVRIDDVHGDYPLPAEMTSLIPERYVLEDGVVKDRYADMDDTEAREYHDAAMEELVAKEEAELAKDFRLTTKNFRLWLGAERRVAVRKLAKEDPIVFDFMDSLELADEVWSVDKDLQSALMYLESKGAPFEGVVDDFYATAVQYKL